MSENEFARVAFVDGLRARTYWHRWDQRGTGDLRHCLLQYVLPCDALNWQEHDAWDIERYDVFIVLFFETGSTALHWLRQQRPDAKIYVIVDAGNEVLFAPDTWGANHRKMLRQLQRDADAIVTWDPTLRHARFLAQIVDKPVVYLPIPLMLPDTVDELRNRSREDVLFALEHKQHPRNPAPTLAALTALQRATGCRVVYTDWADDTTLDMAHAFGLDAEFRAMKWPEKYDMLSRAKLYVDMYCIHHLGRMQIHAASIGTLSLSSTYTASVGHIQTDPWSDSKLDEVLHALSDADEYDRLIDRGYQVTGQLFDHERVRATVRQWQTEEFYLD